MHSQKYSILGGAMVNKNHFFMIQDQVTKVSWYIILQIFVRSTFIDSIHQSELKKKLKTDHAMHSQKFSISVGAIVDKNHFFLIQDQVTKVNCCSGYCTSLCEIHSLIPSINQSEF